MYKRLSKVEVDGTSNIGAERGPSGPRSFCFPGAPPAMVAGRVPYFPGRSEVGPGGTARLLGHLAASRWPRPAGRASPRRPYV